MIKLWTYHPAGFDLKAIDAIDSTKGEYWNDTDGLPHYQESLTRFQRKIGTDQILWCNTKDDQFFATVSGTHQAWEIEIELRDVTCFVLAGAWNGILKNVEDNWSRLFYPKEQLPAGPHIQLTAVVPFPVPGGRLKCLGLVKASVARAGW